MKKVRQDTFKEEEKEAEEVEVEAVKDTSSVTRCLTKKYPSFCPEVAQNVANTVFI